MASPLDFFSAGQSIGSANAPSTAGPQSVMDMFKAQQENQMKLAQTAALFKAEKQYEYATDPSKIESQAKLNASGLGSGGGGNPLQAAAAGGPQVGQGSLGSNVPTSFTSVTGQKFDNQAAEVDKDVSKKQLDDAGVEAVGAVAMKRQLDKMRDLYEDAMSKLPAQGIGSRASAPTPGIFQGLEAMAATKAQKATLDLQGQSNPSWIAYKAAIPEFAQLAERGLYGARGRQVNQLVQQEKLAFPGGTGTKQSDDAQWGLFHQNADAPIQMYDSLHKTFLGTPSPINYVSKYDNPLQSAASSQGTPRADTARDASTTSNSNLLGKDQARQAITTKIAKDPSKKNLYSGRFKQLYGEDL